MNISETEVEPGILELIRNCSRDAADVLALDLEATPVAELVAGVDRCVYDMQHGHGVELDAEEDPSYLFGSLWGEALCRELEWEWASVAFHDHDDSKVVGVFSQDRSLAIYPFHFIYGCLENGAPVTIELAFNMLVDGSRIPELPASGYENVMDNVHHIVPRD